MPEQHAHDLEDQDLVVPVIVRDLVDAAGIPHAAFVQDVADGFRARAKFSTSSATVSRTPAALLARLPALELWQDSDYASARVELPGVTVVCRRDRTADCTMRERLPLAILAALPGRPFSSLAGVALLDRPEYVITRATHRPLNGEQGLRVRVRMPTVSLPSTNATIRT